MKNKLYSAALALCAMASLASCDLDEYNPKEVTGDDVLATYDGFYGLEAKCYEPIYGQLYTVFDFMSMACQAVVDYVNLTMVVTRVQ